MTTTTNYPDNITALYARLSQEDALDGESNSIANQEKWRDGNRWYKLDQFGYEALAETIISRLLERSNIEEDTLFHFTRYRMERMNVHGRIGPDAAVRIF